MKTALTVLIEKAKVEWCRGKVDVVRRVADFCRFKMGMTDKETYDRVVQDWPGLEYREWVEILGEVEATEHFS